MARLLKLSIQDCLECKVGALQSEFNRGLKMNNRSRHIISFLLAIPFGVATFWMIGVLSLGLGLLIPYMLIYDGGFGFFSTIVLGTLVNAALFGLYALYDKYGDEFLDIDLISKYFFAEFTVMCVFILGYIDGWTI